MTADDGTRLYEALRGDRFVLVSPPRSAVPADRVAKHVVSGTETALLVRPDGYVGADQEPDGLQAALTRWGAPA